MPTLKLRIIIILPTDRPDIILLAARTTKKLSCLRLNWYYNKRHQGKGKINEFGGILKNKVFQHVRSGEVKIVNAEGFAKYADEIKGIKSLYMPEPEIVKEPKDVTRASYTKEALQVYGHVFLGRGGQKFAFFIAFAKLSIK